MKKIILSCLAVAGLVCSFATPVHAATGASLSLSTSGSQALNSTFSVAVRETSSVPVAGIQADLTYDATKLQCLGVDGSGSAFAQQYPTSCGNGSVSIARTTQGTTLTGSQHVATVTFKVLAGSGSTSIKAAGSSEILDETVNDVCDATCDSGAVLASYSLTTPTPGKGADPAPTTPSTPAPTNKTATTSNGTSNTTTSDGTVAGDETQTGNEAKADDKKKDDKKSDDKKDDSKDTKSSNAWFWPIALLAVVAGYVAARAVRARRADQAATSAAAAKPAQDSKPKNKKNKK